MCDARYVGAKLRGSGNLADHSQMGKKSLHIPRLHVFRVPLAVKENKAFNPVSVGLFSANTVCGRVVTQVTGYPPVYSLRVSALHATYRIPGQVIWEGFQKCFYPAN